MSVKRSMIDIGFDKNGEADFGVSMSITELDNAKMQQLRAMIPVAVAQAEQIWMDAWMRRPGNSAAQSLPSKKEE